MARNSSGAFRLAPITSREFLPIGRPISLFPIVMPPPRRPSSLAEDFICLPPISKMSDECPSSPIRRAPRSPSSRRPRGPPAPERIGLLFAFCSPTLLLVFDIQFWLEDPHGTQRSIAARV